MLQTETIQHQKNGGNEWSIHYSTASWDGLGRDSRQFHCVIYPHWLIFTWAHPSTRPTQPMLGAIRQRPPPPFRCSVWCTGSVHAVQPHSAANSRAPGGLSYHWPEGAPRVHREHTTMCGDTALASGVHNTVRTDTCTCRGERAEGG